MLFDNEEEYLVYAQNNQEKTNSKYWAICNTEGCFNKNVPIMVDVFVNPPIVYCGCCSTLINNLEDFKE